MTRGKKLVQQSLLIARKAATSTREIARVEKLAMTSKLIPTDHATLANKRAHVEPPGRLGGGPDNLALNQVDFGLGEAMTHRQAPKSRLRRFSKQWLSRYGHLGSLNEGLLPMEKLNSCCRHPLSISIVGPQLNTLIFRKTKTQVEHFSRHQSK